MTNKTAIIPCPPLSDYPEQPKDQSLCTAVPCPHCLNKMWLSEKKKAMIELAEQLNIEYIVKCYHCIMKMAEENPELIANCAQVKIK
jgi:hypothetical protein